MTEEQRMEEGRRMFQIFAARMFEQRVLTAYREKVARERQEKLLEELADERRLDAEREAKKVKEAQKKKDKKRQQKQAKDEERARREADKVAEEAAVKAIEEQKLEEQRQKKEEQRRKREAEKKAQDEEKQRKEAEKQRKLQEAREQQAENERKQREQKEKERKRRDEAKKKEREEREAKEKEARERKEREAAEKRQRDTKSKAEKDAKDRSRKDEQVLKQAPIPVPTILRKPTAVPLPLGLQTVPSAHASPHLQVATPVIAKAPTPVKARQTSFQDSHHSSPKSTKVPSGSSATSPTTSNPLQHPVSAPLSMKPPNLVPMAQQYPPSLGMPSGAPPPGMYPQAYMGDSPAISGNGFPMAYPPMMPGMMPRSPLDHSIYAHQPGYGIPQHRNFATPNGLSFPPGINGIRQMPPGQGMNGPAQSPLGSAPTSNAASISQFGATHTMPSHSRNTSASYEKDNFGMPIPPGHPISRPAPIQRPSSIPHPDDLHCNQEIDDLSKHLGSSALLDDTDDPLNSNVDDLRDSVAPGGHRTNRVGFTSAPMFPDPIGCEFGNQHHGDCANERCSRENGELPAWTTSRKDLGCTSDAFWYAINAERAAVVQYSW
jgi:hypothetical protein